MIEYNKNFGAYAVEFDDAIILWDDEPDENYMETAQKLRDAYYRNIRKIAEAIMEDIQDIYEVTDVDEVIDKLDKPAIRPEIEEVTYCYHRFDNEHIIIFEYRGEFEKIGYVSVDG